MSEQPLNEPEGRPVPAESSPVPAGPASLPWAVVVTRPTPDRLVLRPPRWAFTAVLVPFLFVGAMGRLDRLLWGDWRQVEPAWIGTAVLLVLGGLVFNYLQVILPRVTFDREAGQLLLGLHGRRGRRDLSSVIGVQVLQTRKRFGDPNFDIPAFTVYQMNLILDNPAEPRLQVTNGDLKSARDRARAVADFLGVPVLDSTAPAGAASAASVDPSPMPPALTAIPRPVLTRPAPDVLLIRAGRLVMPYGARVVLGACVLLGCLTAFLGVGLGLGQWQWGLLPRQLVGAAGQGAAGDWVVFAVVLVPLTVLECFLALTLLSLFLGSRARFDRGQGLLTLGRFGRRERPLGSVKAVQIVEDTECQMNLVLDDPRQPRLNLIRDTDVALVRKVAGQVSEFLGVPLLEASRVPSAPAEPGAAPDLLTELNRAPLTAGAASIRGPARLVPRGEECLVLRRRRPVNWPWLGLALMGVVLGGLLVWLQWVGPFAGQPGFQQVGEEVTKPALFILVGLALGLRPLLNRDRFDRGTGMLTMGWFGLKGKRPLADVLAVQLIPGGLVESNARGTAKRGSRERVSYQVNLVLADAYQNRLNLTDDADLEWTRNAGGQLADFLGVPLIDQIADPS
jgi:hypothetical protein